IVAGPEEFSSAVRDLMRNRDMSDALGRNARALVEKRFHWKNLARDMKDAIEEARRPHVTVFNDFPVDRPRHGGQFRIHNLYSRLALHTPVHYFCLQKESDEEEEIIISKNFTQTALPKSFLHRATESLLGRWMGNISVEDILCISFGHHNAFLLREVREAARHGDILITVHPYLWKIIRKYRGHIRIYESLNYETELKKKTLKGILGRFLSWNTGRIERRAVRESSLVLTVSDEEWAAFERDFGVKGKCLTIPNGTDTTQITPSSPEATRQIKEYLGLDGMPVALFLGSAHPPNVEAGWHIIGRIAPQVPDCLFFIVGSVCWVLKNAREIPANVKLFYEVDNASRDVFLRCADMAVNPMTTGAGTSLKMFDFLAAGLPVISTPLGARGVADGNCDFMILNDIEEFPEAIHRLLSDTNWRSRLGIQGRRRVEECFDWGVIAQEMAGRLEDMVGK
ncbi:MAG TPA: glycosyltransferase, partial [Candidatus Sumerlaeota bacterium]|nr:glycosyltransferase [Candidatus Sumerlaeota bacterium]